MNLFQNIRMSISHSYPAPNQNSTEGQKNIKDLKDTCRQRCDSKLWRRKSCTAHILADCKSFTPVVHGRWMREAFGVLTKRTCQVLKDMINGIFYNLKAEK